MELQDIEDLIEQPKLLLKAVRDAWKNSPYAAADYRAIDPLDKQRRVNNTALRQDEWREVPTGVLDANGEPATTTKLVTTNRIAIPLQHLITERLTAFIVGGGIGLSAKPIGEGQKSLFEGVKGVWSSNKLDFRNAAIVRAMLSQCECAEVWYSKVENGTVKLKFKTYAPADGYTLIPIFDSTDDLVAFAVEWQRNGMDGKAVTYTQLYTSDKYYRFETKDGVEVQQETKSFPYGKMPVVYYRQDRSVWANVQSLIDRLEEVISNFCDTNDYFAAPILAIIGEIMGAAEKGKSGQAIQLDTGAKAEYLTWNQMPEAIKLEIVTLINLIYTCVQCPNISFEEMKGLGDVTGVAFDRIMIDAHLKAKSYHQGEYGEGIQRRLNFLISAVSYIQKAKADLDITPAFRLFRINDQRELIEIGLLANGNKPMISQEDSTKIAEQAGLTDNVDETTKEIREDEQRVTALTVMAAGHANDTSQQGEEGSKTKTDNTVTKKGVRINTMNGQNAQRA